MDDSPSPNPALEARILARVAEDRADGSVQSVEQYQALFPGHEGVVRSVLNNLTDPTEREAESDFLSTATALESIGPFNLVRELGRGGQGVVYLAEDTRLEDRQVALKVLTARLDGAESLRRRFDREARLTARLNHPGIAPIHEVGEDDGIHYIAMGFVQGDPLTKRIHETQTSQAFSESGFISFDNDEPQQNAASPPSQSRALSDEHTNEMTRVICGVAEILSVAHSAGLVHRDIKPGNIMVTPSDQPVLLDFGFARDEDSEEGLTISGAAMGTPAYMSPEQIAGHRAQIDHRTDIYSLGVTLFEALNLTRPFRASTRQGLYRAILDGNAPDPRELNPTINRDLSVVVQTMMHPEQDRRYQSADLLVADLKAVLDGRGINARPDSHLTKIIRWARRNPIVAISASAAVLILVVSLAIVNSTLDDYRELADLQLVTQLEEEALACLPANLASTGKFESWLTQAQLLTDSLPRHEERLGELREQALPYTAVDQATDRATHAELPRLRDLRRRISRLDDQLKSIDDDPGQSLAEVDEERVFSAQEDMEEEAKSIEARIGTRRTFMFDDHELQWQHDALTTLTKGLRKLKDKTIPYTQRRYQIAREAHETSIAQAHALWSKARASIANKEECPLYDGFDLQPQEGLLPLSRNEATGLWLFTHLPTQGKDAKPTAASAFILIPGGKFNMGAVRGEATAPNTGPASRIDEAPVTMVSLRPFFLSAVEVTQSRWRQIMGGQPSYYPAGTMRGRVITWENPVENISHASATEYCRRLGLLLPTEAQWEYAARAGSTTVWPDGDNRESLQGAINIADQAARGANATWPEIDDWPSFVDGHAVHAPVSSFRPNRFGLYDMQGNVWEFCRDGYAPYNNAPEPGDGLRLNARATNFIIRGGSFRNSAERTRCAHRSSVGSSIHNGNIGFRVVRTVQQ